MVCRDGASIVLCKVVERIGEGFHVLVRFAAQFALYWAGEGCGGHASIAFLFYWVEAPRFDQFATQKRDKERDAVLPSSEK